jgi:hypothetical protein
MQDRAGQEPFLRIAATDQSGRNPVNRDLNRLMLDVIMCRLAFREINRGVAQLG